ncbi:hypothetical protein [Nocardioides marmoriginsengisoli]|uniref:hypothetical protein n=1 Tax=Nocardioides marmoriginsengisoli TaxID=661483 RepID=UPI0011CEC1DE|nr:hypothetical protein [Nocardioides marmoriginsengisoli]
MKLTSRRLGSAIAAAGLVLGTTTLVASPATAADCNNTVRWWAGYNDLHTNAFKADYTPIRNGPYTSCAKVSNGHRWTDIRFHCIGTNDNRVVWAHIANTNYGSEGWVLGSSLTTAVQNARVRLC